MGVGDIADLIFCFGIHPFELGFFIALSNIDDAGLVDQISEEVILFDEVLTEISFLSEVIILRDDLIHSEFLTFHMSTEDIVANFGSFFLYEIDGLILGGEESK